jgi:PAS domain S-box-containing protein
MRNILSVKTLLLVSVILCVLAAVITFKGYREKHEAQQWVNHTYEVINEAILLIKLLKDAETNQRGYIISGDSAYLKSLGAATAQIRHHQSILRELTADNLEQTVVIDGKLYPYIKDRVQLINNASRIFSINGPDSAKAFMSANRGRVIMDTIQSDIARLIKREERLLSARSNHLSNLSMAMELALYGSVILIAFTSILSLITIKKSEGENEVLISKLADLNTNLEKKVEKQTLGLRNINQELRKTNEDLSHANQLLLASEEEIKSNLDDINTLRSELEISERRYRLLSENSQDMITIMDQHSAFQYVSTASSFVLGYEPDELLGKSAFDFIHPEDADILRGVALKAVIDGRNLLNQEFRFKRKDGAYVWIEAHSTPLRDLDGKVTGIQTANRDITLRKEVERALMKARDKAEEATRAKSTFLSMMSHEIRTPMNAIIGLTNILMQESPSESQIESLKLLKFSGENLLTIINDILDFSKIEAGKISLESIDFDLYALITNITKMLGQRATDKGIKLYFEYDDQVPRIVRQDQVRINQIVVNLLNNAIKFTDKGFVELSVTYAGLKDNKHNIRFSVRDSGIGIEEDNLQLIFESFSQAGSDTTRKFGGTGLGLSITKRLLNVMGSDIEVDSKLGEGSVFAFTMAFEKGNILPQKKSVSDLASRFKQQIIKILIVEDNRVNQIVVSNFLKKWGIEFGMASQGKEALDMIQDKSYHLILMDLQMPEMNGYEASERMRSMSDTYFKDIPIVALTASATTDIRDKALASGMTDFITKPFQPEELQNIIGKYVLTNSSESDSRNIPNANLYTEGDPEFRRELAGLLIKNIRELQETLIKSIDLKNGDLFKSELMKVKATIGMLGDKEFQDLVNNIAILMKDMSYKSEELMSYSDQFNLISKKIVAGLKENNETI